MVAWCTFLLVICSEGIYALGFELYLHIFVKTVTVSNIIIKNKNNYSYSSIRKLTMMRAVFGIKIIRFKIFEMTIGNVRILAVNDFLRLAALAGNGIMFYHILSDVTVPFRIDDWLPVIVCVYTVHKYN